MKTILLKLSGPLQSWGTDSHFETRHTDRYPSKSALIGLIGGALGYRREEEEKIEALNDIDFAVRIDQGGNLLRDYHIAKKYKKNGDHERNYVTNRYYLEDAVFLVGISHNDDKVTENIEYALKHPYFQPFLGRRSNPPTLDFFLKISEGDVISTLKEETWQAAPWYQRKIMRGRESEKYLTLPLYADKDLVDTREIIDKRDRVISFSQKNRRYGFRQEGRIEVPIENPFYEEVKDEHDIMAQLGE